MFYRVQAGAGPPVVNRTLKPGRKLSDSASICSLPEPSSPRLAPNVDRKLKPSTQGSVCVLSVRILCEN